VQVTILVGISGSGKSTWARKQLRDDKNLVIVNRDTLRSSAFSSQKFSTPIAENEIIISQLQAVEIVEALKQRRNVIVDNTNLKWSYITKIFECIDGLHSVNISFKVFDCDIEKSTKRNPELRQDVLLKQKKMYDNVIKFVDKYKQYVPPSINFDPQLKHVIIVDLDGTLALNTSGRSFYAKTGMINDSLSLPVSSLISGKDIIICSGRTLETREETKEWLHKYDIEYLELHMRHTGDMRPDYIVKGEMWLDISQRYYIECMIDDRDQVVNFARRLGFTVFKV